MTTTFYYSDGTTSDTTETILKNTSYKGTDPVSGINTVLTSVDVASTVTSFDNSCFQNCQVLQTINFSSSSNNLESFGDHCFDSCIALTELTTPNSVKILGAYCFYNCGSLSNANIGNNINITVLPEYCFAECLLTETSSMKIIPVNVTQLAEGCFKDAFLVKSLTIPSSVTSFGDYCFCGTYMQSSLSLTIPSSVISFGDYCFSQTQIKSITFADDANIKSFGKYCFSENHTTLTSMTIPSSVTSLGEYCFSNSTITSITLPVISLSDYCFHSSKLSSIVFNNSYNISGVDFISFGNYCFQDSTLSSITIPKEVESLGNYCFIDSNISSVTFESNSKLKSIGYLCFENCSQLKNITIPNTVEWLGDVCFYETKLDTLSYLNPANIIVIIFSDTAIALCGPDPLDVYFYNTPSSDVSGGVYNMLLYPADSTPHYIDGEPVQSTDEFSSFLENSTSQSCYLLKSIEVTTDLFSACPKQIFAIDRGVTLTREIVVQ